MGEGDGEEGRAGAEDSWRRELGAVWRAVKSVAGVGTVDNDGGNGDR